MFRMSHLRVVLPALTLVFLAPMAGPLIGAGTGAVPEAARQSAERRLDTTGPIDTVVAISVDGLNPQAIIRLGARRAPALHQLIREGTGTLNARTALELTDTLPNHTGMVTGRRVDAEIGGHGVTWNDERRIPRTVRAAAGQDVSSVFDVVHHAGGSTAFFASKTKFSLWERSWPGAIDTDVIVEDNAALTARFVTDLQTRTRGFRFLHLSAPDVAGHARGFMGAAYLRAVATTDRLVGEVMRTIESDPTLAGHAAIILTADHGGRGASHRDPTRAVNYTVPFMVWGPDVAPGADLYVINPSYSDPLRDRTTYGDRPVRNGDLANLALDLLELPAVPDSEHGAAQDLVVLDPVPAP